MRKVIVRIFGGIGNQLFCYAAARRLALANDSTLIIDDVSGFERDYKYRRRCQLDHFNIPCRRATSAERLEPFSRVRRYLKRYLDRRLPFEERSYICQEGIDFDLRLMQVKPRQTVYLEGYWQSENYFIDVEKNIRADLRIEPPSDILNRAMAAKIRECLSAALHVRFFDAPSEPCIANAPSCYYSNAVRLMEELAPGAHYFIFSDHPQAARRCIPLPDDRITLVSHNTGDDNAFADLWLMAQCRHFIIANSTFSWWGAWLADHPDKQVVAPGFENRQGKMSWGFRGLLPERWIKI